MTKIIKEGGKTIIQTGARIDTMNANQFEEDIKPALVDGGVDLEIKLRGGGRRKYRK